MFLGPGPQPVLAQQLPHLGGGVVVELGWMLRVHPEDLERRAVRRHKGPEQLARSIVAGLLTADSDAAQPIFYP